MGFTEDAASAALVAAAGRIDSVDFSRPELVRLGSNAVFQLPGDVVARVAPSANLMENARKQVRVADWLASVGYPAVRAIHVEQPIEADGRVVTLWESINTGEVFAPIAGVASLIRQLHELDEPDGLDLPRLQPFGDADDPLPDLSGLTDDTAAFLRDRIAWAREEFPRLPFVLPEGVIHGDANVGNVICDPEGQAVLIDLDSFAEGPREWDLIQTALFYDRLGWHTEQEYRTFVEVYGYDLMEWSGYSTLADMREIAMTSWLSSKAATSASAAADAGKRIEDIRTGASRRDWGAY